MDFHLVALSSMARWISSEEDSNESLDSGLGGAIGSDALSAAGVANDISNVPQDERNRLNITKMIKVLCMKFYCVFT